MIPKRRPVQEIDFQHFPSIECFRSTWRRVDSGSVRIDAPLPILIHWQNREASKTLICFSAASSKVREVPFWTGKALGSSVDANLILVSDPTLILDSTLSLGWYAGSAVQPALIEQLTRVLETMIGKTQPILFGASAGGWAALTYAARLKNATAIPVNPQVDIERYMYFPKYLEKAWLGSPLPFETNVANSYGPDADPSVVYIQNRGDTHHFQEHYPLFEAAYGGSPNFIGLTPDLGKGHVAPDRASLRAIIKQVIECRDHDDLRDRIARVDLKSSGVDKELKQVSRFSPERIDKNYPTIAEQTVKLGADSESFSIDIWPNRDLESKALLYQIEFDESPLDKTTATKNGMSWSPTIAGAFIYSPTAKKLKWNCSVEAAVPKNAKTMTVTVRQWHKAQTAEEIHVNARVSMRYTPFNGKL